MRNWRVCLQVVPRSVDDVEALVQLGVPAKAQAS